MQAAAMGDEHIVWGNIEVSTSSSVATSKTPVAAGHITRIADSDLSSSMKTSTSGAPSTPNDPSNWVLELQGRASQGNALHEESSGQMRALLSGFPTEPESAAPRARTSRAKLPTAEAVRALLVDAGLQRCWSQGSHPHAQGSCRPCHYWHTASGCRSGADCSFCHLPHARRTDAKSKRDASRKLAAEIPDEYVDKSLELLTSRSPVLEAALQQRLMDRRLSGQSPATMGHRPSPSARTHILSL